MLKNQRLGVVIGRFQVCELHQGHLALLDHVDQRHDQILILVGRNNIRTNPSDPFPFLVRKQMLQSRYPEAIILPLSDSLISHKHWSKEVDRVVGETCGESGAVLYGSRDSFIPLYSGSYPTETVQEFPDCSGTTERGRAAKDHIDHPIFRSGWLAAITSQYVVTDPTVDVAIHTEDFSMVLMGRRGADAALRFFGGFVDKTDQSFEAAALREQAEEVLGIRVDEPCYIGSQRIDDPRYRRTEYGIMTTFFAMKYQSGGPIPGDDMSKGEVVWCSLDESIREQLVPEHRTLLTLLLNYKKKRLLQ